MGSSGALNLSASFVLLGSGQCDKKKKKMRRTYDMTNQEMLHKYNCFRERTARRSGKLVKRIVAVASLALDGLDVLAHFLPGKVGGAPLAVPEGHAGIPVVDHRLGLTQLAIPARESHGLGASYQGEGAGAGR